MGIACRDFRHIVDWTLAVGDNLGSKARGPAYVASTAATRGELAVGGFPVGSFAGDTPVRINGVVVANVTSTCTWSANLRPQ